MKHPLDSMKIKDGLALIKIGSHRARDKVQRLLGRLPQGYFDWNRQGEWREVTPEELQKIKDAKIKGVTQSKWTDGLRQYIDWTGTGKTKNYSIAGENVDEVRQNGLPLRRHLQAHTNRATVLHSVRPQD